MQENTKENYSINERIQEILDYLGITRYKLSQETGISEAILNNINKNKNKASIDVVEKILNNYSVINADWLITGKGEMIKNTITAGRDIVDNSASDIKISGENNGVIGGISGSYVNLEAIKQGTRKIIKENGEINIDEDASAELIRWQAQMIQLYESRISDFERIIHSKEEVITAKNEIINSLKAENEELRSLLNKTKK